MYEPTDKLRRNTGRIAIQNRRVVSKDDIKQLEIILQEEDINIVLRDNDHNRLYIEGTNGVQYGSLELTTTLDSTTEGFLSRWVQDFITSGTHLPQGEPFRLKGRTKISPDGNQYEKIGVYKLEKHGKHYKLVKVDEPTHTGVMFKGVDLNGKLPERLRYQKNTATKTHEGSYTGVPSHLKTGLRGSGRYSTKGLVSGHDSGRHRIQKN